MARKKSVEQRNKELSLEGKKLKLYAYKFRMYPNEKQVKQMHQTIGIARFTFNYYLNEKQEIYKNTGESLDLFTFKKSFLQLKTHPLFDWLKTPDKFALENAMMDVDTAYTNFFDGRANFPKFKSKHTAKKSYKTNRTNENIKFNSQNQTVQLPKVGVVSIRIDKKQRASLLENGIHGKIISATISYHGSDTWYVSLACEEMIDLEPKVDICDVSDEEIVGCDVGLTHFLITSKGEKIENPRYYQKSLKNLAKMQRKLAKMVRGSQNYIKQKKKVAKLHLHIKNMRHDFLHKVSRKLVNENQVIVLEDLHVKGMIKNHRLAKSIQDVGWGTFKTFVTYKADWDNKTVVLVDKFFPSSKLCYGCKEKNVLLSLNERTWVCPNCGTEHDRDINASNNIKEEGIRLLKEPKVT